MQRMIIIVYAVRLLQEAPVIKLFEVADAIS